MSIMNQYFYILNFFFVFFLFSFVSSFYFFYLFPHTTLSFPSSPPSSYHHSIFFLLLPPHHRYQLSNPNPTFTRKGVAALPTVRFVMPKWELFRTLHFFFRTIKLWWCFEVSSVRVGGGVGEKKGDRKEEEEDEDKEGKKKEKKEGDEGMKFKKKK